MQSKAVPEIASNVQPAQPVQQQVAQAVSQAPPGPPLPPTGLPVGWTMEQWAHYGHQYLESNK
jgi:hypothetical protein